MVAHNGGMIARNGGMVTQNGRMITQNGGMITRNGGMVVLSGSYEVSLEDLGPLAAATTNIEAIGAAFSSFPQTQTVLAKEVETISKFVKAVTKVNAAFEAG